MVYRLLRFERQFFPSNKSVRDTIRQLCEKGAMKCKISAFSTYDHDGTLIRESRHKILIVSDKFRKESINAMAEGLRSSLNGYLLPEKK